MLFEIRDEKDYMVLHTNFNDKLILEKIICIYEDMKSEGNGTQMGNLGNYKLLTFFACIPIIGLR